MSVLCGPCAGQSSRSRNGHWATLGVSWERANLHLASWSQDPSAGQNQVSSRCMSLSHVEHTAEMFRPAPDHKTLRCRNILIQDCIYILGFGPMLQSANGWKFGLICSRGHTAELLQPTLDHQILATHCIIVFLWVNVSITHRIYSLLLPCWQVLWGQTEVLLGHVYEGYDQDQWEYTRWPCRYPSLNQHTWIIFVLIL